MTTIGSTNSAIPDSQSADRPVPAAAAQARLLPPRGAFFPAEPATFDEAGLLPIDVEPLVLKLLLSGPTVGRKIAEQVRLPFGLMNELLRSLRGQLLLTISNQAAMGDFEYDLTEDGRKRAHWHAERCTYCGAAPVSLEEYITSVSKQSLRNIKVRLADICRALADLMLPPATLSQLGQAVHGGRGLFLYGQPGNGKTSIAERLSGAFSQHIWIPRRSSVTGEIIRLFDPANHIEAQNGATAGTL